MLVMQSIAVSIQGLLGYEPNTLTTAPLRSCFESDVDSRNTSRTKNAGSGKCSGLESSRYGPTRILEMTAAGFEPTPLRNGSRTKNVGSGKCSGLESSHYCPTRTLEMTAVGFEPTPLRNGALSHRLRPLGHTVHVMQARCASVICAIPVL